MAGFRAAVYGSPVLTRPVRKDLFSRTSRRQIRTPDDLVVQVERLLAKRCQALLGLARRAGALVIGFHKVRGVIAGHDAKVLISASDAGADGIAKLVGLDSSLVHVQILTREELSLAVGRENVVHAALTRGRLAAQFVSDINRLAGIRQGSAALNAMGAATTGKSETRSLSENTDL